MVFKHITDPILRQALARELVALRKTMKRKQKAGEEFCPVLVHTKGLGWIFTPDIRTRNPVWTTVDIEDKDEEKWDELFAKSQDKLSEMAREVQKDIDEGKTEPMDFDKL